MAVKKISVTLQESVIDRARELVGERGLSQYLSEALRLRIQHDSVRQLLVELNDEFGPVPDEIRAETRAFWGLP